MKWLNRNLMRVVVLLVLATACVGVASGEVIVFDKYNSEFTYEDGRLMVHKDLRLKNVGDSPVIPGEIHFKVSRKQEGESEALSVSNFVAENDRGDKLSSRKVKNDRVTDLIFSIWDPLLPDFHYDFTLSYEIPFEPDGILFYQVNIPNEQTTIPIKEATTEVSLPGGYHVTHAPGGEVTEEGESTLISWESESDISFEYSLLPLPSLGVPMVNVFWILVIVLFIGIFLLRIAKAVRQ